MSAKIKVKRKTVKKIAVISCAIVLIISLYAAYGSINVNKVRRNDDFIYAYGNQLYLKDKPISLRGVNLGGWLVPEGWMTPLLIEGQDDNKDGEKLTYLKWVDRLIKNPNVASYENAVKLIDVYTQNWITKEDIEFIKSIGNGSFNCVRLPFGWFNLYDLDYNLRADGFKWLDACISWCEEVGLYCILDLHGAYGSQNNEHTSGDDTQCILFNDLDCQNKTVELWRRVAERYKDNPVVAGYDILNEPWGEKNITNSKQFKVYDKIYDAIRSVDSKHLIIMEACWTFFNLPNPVLYGWENVVYSLHWYKPNSISNQSFLTFQKLSSILRSYQNVPVYIGEFPLGDSYEDLARTLALCEKKNWSWTSWTYKTNDSWNWGFLCTWKKRRAIDNLTVEEITRLYTDCKTDFNNQTDAYKNLLRYFEEVV